MGDDLTKRLTEAKTDKAVLEELIGEYTPFLKAYVKSLAFGKQNFDDCFSIALEAFWNAIVAYDEKKGYFISFAKVVVKNRILNYFEKNKKFSNETVFSHLEKDYNDGSTREFDAVDFRADFANDSRLEIEAIKDECLQFDIDFFALERCAPKAEKTRTACLEIVNFVATNSQLVKKMRTKNYFPAKEVLTQLQHISKKVIERHKNFLIAAVIIASGDYPILKDYLNLQSTLSK